MHYFKKHIGDYSKKTGRLSMLQHGAYTLLMDSCYDREQFPTLEQAIEWVWASSKEEIEAIEFVLKKFFTLEDGVYTQKRIKEEIADYHYKGETNRRIALEREAKRRENSTNRARIVNDTSPEKHEPPPNHKPLTTNQKPLTIVSKDTKALMRPEFVSEDVWHDFEKLRKAKKAPLTKTALSGIQVEADKAGITLEAALVMACNRGWTSFKADWIQNKASIVKQSESFKEKDARAARELYERVTGKQHPENAAKGLLIESKQHLMIGVDHELA